jgi:hypothetical protein
MHEIRPKAPATLPPDFGLSSLQSDGEMNTKTAAAHSELSCS